jgi:hypothetical protein
MPQSPLRLIKRSAEYISQNEVKKWPRKLRGIYVLYKECKNDKYDVVYVGMAGTGNRGGIRGRLMKHSIKKGSLWTHFSLYEVWDNIREEEIRELEGLFRHIYRHDSQASKLNIQRGFRKLVQLRNDSCVAWSQDNL